LRIGRVSRRVNNRLRGALRKLGIAHQRPGQRDVIQAVLDGEDALAVMPTGSGKSLCYQVPALALDGPTLVVSPVDAATLNSTLTAREEARAMEEIRRQKTRIVYVTPERLALGERATVLGRRKPALAVIDEAHCIWQWGPTFVRRTSRSLRRSPRSAIRPCLRSSGISGRHHPPLPGRVRPAFALGRFE